MFTPDPFGTGTKLVQSVNSSCDPIHWLIISVCGLRAIDDKLVGTYSLYEIIICTLLSRVQLPAHAAR